MKQRLVRTNPPLSARAACICNCGCGLACAGGEAAPGFVTEKETLRYCDIVSVVLTCQDAISVVSKDLLQSFGADSAST